MKEMSERGSVLRAGRLAPYVRVGRKAYIRGHGPREARPEEGEEKSVVQLQSRHMSVPTMDQMESDRLNALAMKYWAPETLKSHEKFDDQIIKDIYGKDIVNSNYSVKRTMVLEFSHYLENFLWPNFEGDKASMEHVVSIVLMVNEKFRERVPAWSVFYKSKSSQNSFAAFFKRVLRLCVVEPDSKKWIEGDQWRLIRFLNYCFTSMEVDLIREQVQKLVSLASWSHLLDSRRELELSKVKKWRKFYKAIQKKEEKMSAEEKAEHEFEKAFMKSLLDNYLRVLESIPQFDEQEDCNRGKIGYCEHCLMLLIDMEALLPARRFFDTLLDDCKLIVKSYRSNLYKRGDEAGRLFRQLLDQLKFYAKFEIANDTGTQLTVKEAQRVHYDRITALQRAVFAKYPDMKSFALATVSSIDESEVLRKTFGKLHRETLYDVAEFLCLAPTKTEEALKNFDAELLRDVLVYHNERRASQLRQLNEQPLYPTESVIWDENVVPGEFYDGSTILALPKLSLQFLTLQDYLWRNFKLFQLESTYEIRGDIEDAIMRLKPYRSEDEENSVIFHGWARMALPLNSFSIVEVAKPKIGETQPSRVRADVTINVSVREEIRREWESLRKHDVCFLLTVRPAVVSAMGEYDFSDDFVSQVGLLHVRGCEIEGMLDENGRVIEEGPEEKPKLSGESRTFRVILDANQYQMDMEKSAKGEEDVYDTFNILMRRKPKENNFKAVLETIRELMNTDFVVPEFLQDLLLGYGDPAAAHYKNMADESGRKMNFRDTFLSFKHVVHSFPNHEVAFQGANEPTPPFYLTFEEDQQKPRVVVEEHRPMSKDVFASHIPGKNEVSFTPTQVEAIRSGMNKGLTVIVGPPGTGKTDVAVQIISNLYHNFPSQRTLIVTHSNQALNQLFEKIMALDIDERHLLRLGHGEEALETEKDFGRYGRVNYVLARRLELLETVRRLQLSLGVQGDVAYTCETAGYFYMYEVLSRWEEFLANVEEIKGSNDENRKSGEAVARIFPFKTFFEGEEGVKLPLFKSEDFEEDLSKAHRCWRHLKEEVFDVLEEFRAFELLRSGLDRSRYLLIKEAKIIAMTCTHAALKRKELVNMGFKFDNIIMEEAAQILEIETFIPLLLQNPEQGYNRLKRWTMIGDHHQLPPVIKNMAFQKFSNMEQSLFTRLVRLGVPTVDLDAQGRARPSIASLYNWRYRELGNLPHVLNDDKFIRANGGFCYDYQLINVDDLNGVGESQPSPFFYQNLAEAEFVVATFMYMRMLGYPAEKISILTTYNGQKHLIKDVINARCAKNELLGEPHKISTVDKYQGQQNDYILLSLVRTNNIGHLRDVRRLVVAMSRARLGLYIFARVNLFKNCFELQPTFNILTKRPLQLHLAPKETYETERLSNVNAPDQLVISGGVSQMSKFVYDFYAAKMAALTQMAKAATMVSSKTDDVEMEEPKKDEDKEKKEEQKSEEIVNELDESMG